jgi:nucleoside-diphosphate-sugar epimerase
LIHIATDTSFAPNPDVVINTSVDMTLNVLKSATRVPSIKSAVVTSSRVAMWHNAYGPDITVSKDTWNTPFLELAYSLSDDDPGKGFAVCEP